MAQEVNRIMSSTAIRKKQQHASSFFPDDYLGTQIDNINTARVCWSKFVMEQSDRLVWFTITHCSRCYYHVITSFLAQKGSLVHAHWYISRPKETEGFQY